MSDSLGDGARATSSLDSRSRERNNNGTLRALLKSAERKGVRVLQAAVAATAYLIVARERLAFVIQPDGVAALWQPAEIALATLRLSGHRASPSILAGIARRRRRGTFRRPAPLPGKHTAEVLAELGLARTEIERLVATKVVALP